MAHRTISLLCVGTILCAQTAGLEFDVASIRLNKGGATPTGHRNARGKVSYRNFPMFAVLVDALGIPPQRVSGAPSWTNTERFDIAAVVEESPSVGETDARARNRERVRTLLEKRCGLRTHRETRMLDSYILIVGRKGHHLVPAKSDEPNVIRLSPGRDRLECHGQDMDGLADFLWTELDRPVLNQTGLVGGYDFQLDFEPERHDAPDIAPASGTKPSLFAALQDQLGLKLESRKMPVEMLIIDHIERPSEN